MDIEKDIQDAQKNCSCNFRISDAKIICSFNISEESKYFSVEKIFDNWQDFVDYSMEIFKDQINEEL